MKSFRSSTAYKIIKKSGYTFNKIKTILTYYDYKQIKQNPESLSMLDALNNAIKKLNKQKEAIHYFKDNPFGDIDVKYAIGETVWVIIIKNNNIMIKEYPVIGIVLDNPFFKERVIYICGDDYKNAEYLWEIDIFRTYEDAEKRIREGIINKSAYR